MTEDREALLDDYRQSRSEFLAAIEGLPDELLTARSIDGWSVKDHMAHLAFWDEIRASEVLRLSAGHASAWRLTEEQDESVNAAMTAARRELPLDQVRWEFEVSRRRFMDALEQASPSALDASRYGEAGLVSGHERQHAGWIRRWREEKGV